MAKKRNAKKPGRVNTSEPIYTVTFTETELFEVMGALDNDEPQGGLNDLVLDPVTGEEVRTFKQIFRRLYQLKRDSDSKSRTRRIHEEFVGL